MEQNKDQKLILCSDRLPINSGEYRVQNNSSCNNGEGLVTYDVESGWDIPRTVKSFYKVIGWYE
jgi:hypothetical protein